MLVLSYCNPHYINVLNRNLWSTTHPIQQRIQFNSNDSFTHFCSVFYKMDKYFIRYLTSRSRAIKKSDCYKQSSLGKNRKTTFFDRGSKKKIQQEKLNQQRNEETTNLSFFYFSTQTIILLTLKPNYFFKTVSQRNLDPLTALTALILVLGQQ